MTDRSRTKVCSDGKVRGNGRGKIPQKKCLTPDCEGIFGAAVKPGGRGLCHKCHMSASSLVRRGATTWAEMEELGLAQPKYASMVERGLIMRRKERNKSEKEGGSDEAAAAEQEPVDTTAQA